MPNSCPTGLANSVAGSTGRKFSTFFENCSGLKTASGLGVIKLVNWVLITCGSSGVLVYKGVGVIVGVSVIVGVKVIVGVNVIVGVRVIVGEGGKNRYATGSAYRLSKKAATDKPSEMKTRRQPCTINSRRFRKYNNFRPDRINRIPSQKLIAIPKIVSQKAVSTPVRISRFIANN